MMNSASSNPSASSKPTAKATAASSSMTLSALGKSGRNKMCHYLRISPYLVLPLFVYISRDHQSWFTDQIFQQLLVSLSPLIPDKIETEREKTAKDTNFADIHREGSFQIAYFLKPTENLESILIPNEQNDPYRYQGVHLYKMTLYVIVEPFGATLDSLLSSSSASFSSSNSSAVPDISAFANVQYRKNLLTLDKFLVPSGRGSGNSNTGESSSKSTAAAAKRKSSASSSTTSTRGRKRKS